ncbi:DNA cytosine methyltransferase [Myxococcus sp. NMCA1]|uniref:DNA cytosine methyltransferase n=1 Tax=Myxococcus sp. NMCA1 TaxID=2996785 RepID=UPI00228640F7|nr:DNA cytosine methyltransferase [Myxococcus sp. NMCA1]WAM23858.1 DNA cytosine methyltransferase [Myxococcus sp. NMCA1]
MTCTNHYEFTAGYLFCGSGPGALGNDMATVEVAGSTASWRNLGGVDFDEGCCKDYTYLTGAPSLCADIATLAPEKLRKFWGPRAPDMTKWSPPCKGASKLLPASMAATQKYQDMNQLMFHAAKLVLAAYPDRDNRPRLIVVENVPSFRTRCREVLGKTIRLLREAGYEVNVTTHDLGQEGGLAQSRERFTLSARDSRRCPVQVALPPYQGLRGVGEVLAPLPWPDDPHAGRMHRLPRVSWLNAVRLALIPPGGDWRDLPKRGHVVETLQQRGLWPTGMDTAAFRELVEEQLGNPVEASQKRREVHRRHPVQAWAAPSPTVSGPGGAGLCAVEDPRPLEALAMGAENPARHTSKYAVQDWAAAARTVTGAQQVGSGGPAVADARAVEALAMRKDARPGAAGVLHWTRPSATVIATSWVSGGSSPVSVADPRAVELLGLGQTADGAGSYAGRPGLFGVGDWRAPSPTVTGKATVSGGNAQASVADQRVERLGLGCHGRNGFYGVIGWDTTAGTITGSMQLDNGSCSVADPRLPHPRVAIDIRLALQLLAEGWEPPKGTLAPAILSPLSGCWHRPLTTLELAVLQGLPHVHRGAPLVLAGNSDSVWREHIGNAIPVGGALAWGRVLLESLLRSELGEGWALRGDYWFDAPSLNAGYAA